MLLLKYSNLLLKKSSHCVDLNLSLVYPQMFYYPLFINLQRKVKRSQIFLRWLFIVTFYHCFTSLVYHQCLLSRCLLSLVYHHLFIVTLFIITCLSSFVYCYFVYHHLFIIICLLLLCLSSLVCHFTEGGEEFETDEMDPNAGRFVRYQFTPQFLKLKTVGAT